MRLARGRRQQAAPVELMAEVEGHDSGLLVSLRELVPDADPVAALRREGVSRLQESVDRILRHLPSPIRSDEVLFEPPVAHCSKICCLALNYGAHAAESGLDLPPAPVLFFKPPSALVGHGAEVRPPRRTRQVDHEVELAVVIGNECRDVDRSNWQDVVAGYTIMNDVTARDMQLQSMARDEPWDHAKAFDTFAPLGPFLVTPDEVRDVHALRMTLTVAGEVRQEAFTGDMIHDVPQILANLSDGMTLMPGDVIATGTTAGIGAVRHGDVMTARVEGLGSLSNRVAWR